MGYTTSFDGTIKITPDLSARHLRMLEEYLDEPDDFDNVDLLVTVDGDGLEWNHMEKSYDMEEKLVGLISRFFGPWGYTLDGVLVASGEDSEDRWRLVVKDNVVSRLSGHGTSDCDRSEEVTRENLAQEIFSSNLAAGDWLLCLNLSAHILKKYRLVLR